MMTARGGMDCDMPTGMLTGMLTGIITDMPTGARADMEMEKQRHADR